MSLILASTSKYRKELLERLNLDFKCINPEVDESELKTKGLTPFNLSQELSYLKASAVFKNNPESIIIGGDQVACLDNKILSKTGSAPKSVEQLLLMQGKIHYLYTSICLLGKNTKIIFTNTTELKMRPLSRSEIENYISIDNPIDCAGSYKLEKLGISLFESIKSEDFSAIQGIPLIELTSHLKSLGIKSI